MNLVVGALNLGEHVEGQDAHLAVVEDGERRVLEYRYRGSFVPPADRFGPVREQVTEVVVGYGDQPDLNFLAFFPRVRSVNVYTSTVQDISGLRHLPELRDLSLQRPRCTMEVLGELRSLEQVYLDGWRPGAESLFRLTGLRQAGIQSYGRPSFEDLSHWEALEELWVNRGKLERLDGLPAGLRKLRLTTQRQLASLEPLKGCVLLEKLELDACSKITSLHGIENCRALKLLSVAQCKLSGTLAPLAGLQNLEYVFLGERAIAGPVDIESLYDLPKLTNLIIPRKTGLDPARLRQTAPRCELVLSVH
jgi:Leucine-rich repeat (LRR) protein